jgi:pyruvate/2-oxoglutarate/acetoin dehydrogenase E1 component
MPLTITTCGGAGLSAAAQHSQSLEALLCHIPGLKVVYPSNPYDMKGLMTACIREDNPTIMIKHKRLLGMSGEVPEESYEIPLGVRPTSCARAPTSPSSAGVGWSTRRSTPPSGSRPTASTSR